MHWVSLTKPTFFEACAVPFQYQTRTLRNASSDILVEILLELRIIITVYCPKSWRL